jgi:hypothetical protein
MVEAESVCTGRPAQPNHIGWRGQTASIDLNKFEVLPGVLHGHRISSPLQTSQSRLSRSTVIEFANGVKLGRNQW